MKGAALSIDIYASIVEQGLAERAQETLRTRLRSRGVLTHSMATGTLKGGKGKGGGLDPVAKSS
jgi:hypothetical protein